MEFSSFQIMDNQRRKRLIYMPLGILSRLVVVLLLNLVWNMELKADSSVNVPLEHRVYRFVERFDAKGRVGDIGFGFKPYSRNEIRELIKCIDEEYGAKLSPVEESELERLRSEFSADSKVVGRTNGETWLDRLRKGRALVQYQTDSGAIFADFLMRQQTDRFSGRGRTESEMVYRNRVGAVVRGHIGSRLGFRIGFLQTREQGSRSYVYRQDVYERRLELPQLKGDLADFHEGTAYLSFAVGPVDVQVGKDELMWGPAPLENLGLSKNTPSYNLVRLKSRLGAFKLISVSAELRPCPDRPDSPLCRGVGDSTATYITNGISRPLDREKYLAAHRLEVALAPWIDLGFQEVVIYGDRGPELSYINPLMFYWAAQSYLGDKDNVMMGLDLDIHPGHGRRYYLAYVVDDLKKAGIFSDDFANKFSLQAGMLWVDPLGLSDSEFKAEYVRIEPWIYSHKFPINTFRHFDAPMGHSLGPNSDQWYGGVTKRLSRDLSVELRFRRIRHGENILDADGTIENVGADLHYNWRRGDERDTKEFLAGHLVRRTELGLEINWRIWPGLGVELEYVQEWGRGVPLPPAWGPAVPLNWRTGYGDGIERHLRFDLRINEF